MPHFLATKIYDDFPFSQGEYEFYCQIPSLRYVALSIIGVRYRHEHFFLQVIKRENDILCKVLGITRVLPTGILKNALWILAQKCHTLTHNLQKGTLRQEVVSPFLLPWHKIFDVLSLSREVECEIGFGSGRHLLDLAQKYSQKIFIGFEIHTPSIEQVLRQIQLLGLQNLYVLCFDARLMFEILPSNVLECIYLHFPVPWNKAKHRRVMGERFLAQSLRVLKKGGMFELRSDDYEYFLDSFHLALESKSVRLQICKNNRQNIISKYEARWMKQDKDIYDLQILSLQENPKITYDCNFIFPQNLLKSLLSKPISKEKVQILTNKHIFQKGFLHIGDIYQDEVRIIFVVSLGDFLAPLNRVIILEKQEVKYVPAPLIPTQAVKIAYQKFITLLEKI